MGLPKTLAAAAAIAAALGGGAAGGAESPGASPGPHPPGVILRAPPGHRIYRAAFPDFGGPEDRVSAARIRAFEHLSGRPIAWAYFSNNWLGGHVRFPSHDVG
ncbi:MAG: hypothetical protein ACRDK1_01020, partial [Solirubrobacterales bacterium]